MLAGRDSLLREAILVSKRGSERRPWISPQEGTPQVRRRRKAATTALMETGGGDSLPPGISGAQKKKGVRRPGTNTCREMENHDRLDKKSKMPTATG